MLSNTLNLSQKQSPFLSRDRFLQIRNHLYLPGIDSSFDKHFIENYMENMEKNKPKLLFPPNVQTQLPKEIFNAYLMSSYQEVAIEPFLQTMSSLGVSLDREASMLISSSGFSRVSESLVLFSVLLMVSYSKNLFCHYFSSYENISFFDFSLLLVSGMEWFQTASLSDLLLPEVHFLELYKQAKSGPLRKQCSMCSLNNQRKRSKYVCKKCGKSFCCTEECFVMYHRNNNFVHYPFL